MAEARFAIDELALRPGARDRLPRIRCRACAIGLQGSVLLGWRRMRRPPRRRRPASRGVPGGLGDRGRRFRGSATEVVRGAPHPPRATRRRHQEEGHPAPRPMSHSFTRFSTGAGRGSRWMVRTASSATDSIEIPVSAVGQQAQQLRDQGNRPSPGSGCIVELACTGQRQAQPHRVLLDRRDVRSAAVRRSSIASVAGIRGPPAPPYPRGSPGAADVARSYASRAPSSSPPYADAMPSPSQYAATLGVRCRGGLESPDGGGVIAPRSSRCGRPAHRRGRRPRR